MSVYLVTYDLMQPGKDYAKLHTAIKSLGSWWHHLDSAWLIVTSLPSKTIANSLLAHMDKNDKLLVVRCDKDAAWYGIDEKGSSWLSNNL